MQPALPWSRLVLRTTPTLRTEALSARSSISTAIWQPAGSARGLMHGGTGVSSAAALESLRPVPYLVTASLRTYTNRPLSSDLASQWAHQLGVASVDI